MPIALTSLLLHVGADTRDAEEGLGRVNNHMGKLGGIVGGVAATFTGGMAAVAGGVLAAVGSVRSFIDAANESTIETTRLNAVLASTKGVAGLTRADIDQLTNRLSYMSGVDDEVVTSAESMLLTFTNIHKEVFPAAAEAALNLGQRFGSVEQASVQIGKALQDPIKGVSALARVGIVLSEQQKQQIKDFVASGNIMGAQKVILKELNTEFGGLAKSVGQTLPGALGNFHTQMGNIKEDIGLALSEPIRKLLITYVNPFLFVLANGIPGAIDKAKAKFLEIGTTLKQMGVFFLPLKGALDTIRTTFTPLTNFVIPGFLQQFQGIKVTLPQVSGVLNDLVQGALQQFYDLWRDIGPALAEAAPHFVGLAQGTLQLVQTLAPLAGLLNPVVYLLKSLVPDLAPLIPLFASIAGQLQQALIRNLALIVPQIMKLVDVLLKGLHPVFVIIIDVIKKLAPIIGDLLTTALDTLGPVIAQIIGLLADHLGPILEELSPILSDVISSIGDWIAQLATDLMPLIQAVGQLLMKVLPPAFDFIGERVKFLLQIFKAVWPLIQTIVDVAMTNIRNIIKIITDIISGNWSQLGKDLMKFAQDSFTGIFRIIGSALQAIWNLILTMTAPIRDAVLKPFQMARDSIAAIWKALGNFTVDAVNNFVISSINNFIGKVAQAVDWVTDHLHAGKPLANAEHGIIGNLPHFAQGGVQQKTGWAVVGEEGPELAWLTAGSRVWSNAETMTQHTTGNTGGGDDTGKFNNASSNNPLQGLLGDIGSWFIHGAAWLKDQAFKAFGVPQALDVPPFGNIGGVISDAVKGFFDNNLLGGDISGALGSAGAHWWLAHITQGFHPPSNPAHGGIDFGIGFHTPLAALLGGLVYRAGYFPWGGELDVWANLPGYGRGLENYTHLDLINPAFMRPGAFVPSGAIVGLSGGENPGYPGGLHPAQRQFSSGPHFHYNWFVSRPWAHDDLNPTPFINSLRGGAAIRKGFANGGWVTEPVVGYGMHTGGVYTFAENGPEYVNRGGRGGGDTIIVNATTADEGRIGRSVVREILWQQQIRGKW